METIRKISWGDMEIKELLGHGGEATVYLAELKTEGRLVAVKTMHPVHEKEAGHLKRRSWEEATRIARLHHPNIISVYGIASFSDDDNHPDMVMEYMPGRPLQEVVQEDRGFAIYPWEKRVQVAAQVASGMAYMHSMGIIHFDLKDSNVMVDIGHEAGDVVSKICDFGFAREKQEDMSFMQGYGTEGWMAPEVMQLSGSGQKISEKADVYSFGMIMHLLIFNDLRPSHKNLEMPESSHNSPMEFTRACLDALQPQDENLEKDHEHVRHPSVPEWCYHQWMEWMSMCLAFEACKRPSFSDLELGLDIMLDDLNLERAHSFISLQRQMYLFLEESGQHVV